MACANVDTSLPSDDAKPPGSRKSIYAKEEIIQAAM
jgi:hypothetical protein